MGKVKRLGRKHSNHHDNPQSTKSKVIRRQHSQIKPHSTKEKAAQAQKNGSQTPRLRVPFSKHDNLLLVGEGKSEKVVRFHVDFLSVVMTTIGGFLYKS